MSADHREDAVEYYDRFSGAPPGDVEFYRARVTPATRVLELGCGTGRVLVPLAQTAAYIHGLDRSSAMLALCQEKLAAANIGRERATAEMGDITNFDLTGRLPAFDLIIAPFRVMQNLETDAQVTALLTGITRHLAPGGVAILNTFNPRRRSEIEDYWRSYDGRQPTAIYPDGEGTVSMTVNMTRFRDHPLTVFPELLYRRFAGNGHQISESTLKVAMRVWYPAELIALLESHGFAVTERCGGYGGERWEEGPELVVAFRRAH